MEQLLLIVKAFVMEQQFLIVKVFVMEIQIAVNVEMEFKMKENHVILEQKMEFKEVDVLFNVN